MTTPSAVDPHAAVKRVSFAEHLKAAQESAIGAGVDRDRAIRMVGAATQLPPLHAIQTAFDALVRTVQDRRQGQGDPYGKSLDFHFADARAQAEYHRDVLKTAYEAAEAMIGEMSGHFPKPAPTPAPSEAQTQTQPDDTPDDKKKAATNKTRETRP